MADNGSGAEVLKKSVTASDYNRAPLSGIFHFMLPGSPTAPDLPAFWSPARDHVLFNTLYRSSMWAAAISLAITKLVAQSFEVESDVPLRAKRAQELFLSLDSNRGWVGGLSKHLQGYLLTDNGGPVEIVRASGAAGSRILGLIPLDTFRAIRTGDPEIPLLYPDRLGAGGPRGGPRPTSFFSPPPPPPPGVWGGGAGPARGRRAFMPFFSNWKPS